MRANNCNNCEFGCHYNDTTPCKFCEFFSEWKPAVCECCRNDHEMVKGEVKNV